MTDVHDTLPAGKLTRARREGQSIDSGGMWHKPNTYAEQLLPADTDHDRWALTRRQGIGGSDALAVCGLSNWSSPYEVWLDKTGQIPLKPETLAMRLGRELEPVVAKLFCEETGLKTRRTGTWRSRRSPWMLGNPDRLTSDGGLLEVKTTNSYGGKQWLWDQVPDHAETQSAHYLAVTGAPGAWVAALIGNERLEVRYVERDEELIADLDEIERHFWTRHVLAKQAPAVDGHKATTEAIARLHAKVGADTRELPAGGMAVVVERERLRLQIKALTEELEARNNELKLMIGDAAFGTVDGQPVASYKEITQRRIPPKVLREQHPTIARAIEVSVSYRELRILAKVAGVAVDG